MTHKQSQKVRLVFVLALAVALIVAGLLAFSGGNSWICRDGEWVKRGEPNYPKPDSACIDGTPYYFNDGLSGLEVAYPERWRDLTEISTEKTRRYRRVVFSYKTADGGRLPVLALTIHPIDAGAADGDASASEAVLRNERYFITATRPSPDDFVMRRMGLTRLVEEAEMVVGALRFRDGGGVGECKSYSVNVCPAECVICPSCKYCSSVTCQSAASCQSLGFDRSWSEETVGP